MPTPDPDEQQFPDALHLEGRARGHGRVYQAGHNQTIHHHAGQVHAEGDVHFYSEPAQGARKYGPAERIAALLAVLSATTAVTAVGLKLAHGTDGAAARAQSNHADPGPPVTLSSVELVNGADIGRSMAFDRPLDLTSSDLTALATTDAQVWARARGGVDVDHVIVQVVATGNRRDGAHPPRILDMQVSDQRCSAPLAGTLLFNPPQGPGPSLKLGFNLDVPDPHAQSVQVSKDRPQFGGSYFEGNTIPLKYQEDQVFEIYGLTEARYCEFRITMTVLDGTRQVPVTFGNGTQPFRVTAGLYGTYREPDQSRYKRVYEASFVGSGLGWAPTPGPTHGS